MKPEVSVLLPCFNAAGHLDQCLESLSSQNLRAFEIIAVDDGSEDATPELLRRAASRDPRLRVFRRPHRGIAATIRTAAEEAKAPFLARMDADDICSLERLALQLSFLQGHPEIDVVSSRIRMFPRSRLGEGLLRYESWVNGLLTHEQIVRDLFVESPLPHPSVMIRREGLERVGGYRDAGWPEDYDLWMRMARAGSRFAKLPEVLLCWRDRPERASRNDPKFSTESFLALKEHYLLETFLAGRPRIAVWGAGPIGKRWALRLRRRGVVVSHFVEIDPRKIGKRIHAATVVAAAEVHQLKGTPLLVAVGALSRQRGRSWLAAREEIRSQLEAAGFTEGRDFVCIA